MDADTFVNQLKARQAEEELARVQRYYRGPEAGNQFIGVRMGAIFKLAKQFVDLPLNQIEALLDSPYYEARMGAVSVMDYQARRRKTAVSQRQALFDLYLRRHDRINNWDLVDRAAPYVIGGYLVDKPRDILYQLAASPVVWERRTAIVSTYYFIRQNDLDDTFGIAERLLQHDRDLVQKAVGGWLREAGKRDEARLRAFVRTHAQQMPQLVFRYAIEKLDEDTRQVLRALRREESE